MPHHVLIAVRLLFVRGLVINAIIVEIQQAVDNSDLEDKNDYGLEPRPTNQPKLN